MHFYQSLLCHISTGGGLPIGSILLIEEDKIGRYAKYLTKLFLAEGTVHKHALFVANYDNDPLDTVFDIDFQVIKLLRLNFDLFLFSMKNVCR